MTKKFEIILCSNKNTYFVKNKVRLYVSLNREYFSIPIIILYYIHYKCIKHV